MTKSQITLVLGIVSLVTPCIPCFGTTLYMVAFAATMILGILAHQDADAEDKMLAKIGMGTSTLPLIACVIFMIGYVLLIVATAVLGAVTGG